MKTPCMSVTRHRGRERAGRLADGFEKKSMSNQKCAFQDEKGLPLEIP